MIERCGIIGNTARSPNLIGTESECRGEWEIGERMALLVPGAGLSPTHYHANNDVCWYIMSGRIRCIQARSDCSNRRNVEASGNVWPTEEHDTFVTPRR